MVRRQSLTLSGPSILLWASVVWLSLPGRIRGTADRRLGARASLRGKQLLGRRDPVPPI